MSYTNQSEIDGDGCCDPGGGGTDVSEGEAKLCELVCGTIFLPIYAPYKINKNFFPNEPKYYDDKSFWCLFWSASFGVLKSAILCPCLFCGHLNDDDKQCPVFHAYPCMKLKTGYIDGKSCREICATCCTGCAETCCVICCCPGIKKVKISKVVITDQPGGKYSVTGNYVASPKDKAELYNLPTSCNGAFSRA